MDGVGIKAGAFLTAEETAHLSQHQKRVYDVWRDRAPENGVPARGDLDVLEFPRSMPFVVILDVFSEPPDFRYRLMGTGVTANTYGDYTGMKLSQLDGKGPGSKIWNILDTVRKRCAPMLLEAPYTGPKKGLLRSSTLYLPLSNNRDRSVNHLFLVVDFQKADGEI